MTGQKRWQLIFLSIFLSTSAFGKEITMLNHANSKDLALYALQNIYNDENDVTYEVNESGFIRVSFPPPARFQEFSARVRLNYWPKKLDNQALEIAESVHTHPQYFESVIVQGGYTHVIYQISDVGAPFRTFLRDKVKKNAVEQQPVYLEVVKTETLQAGDILGMPTSAIHKVIRALPGTLSINVVYPKTEHNPTFKVFLSKSGKKSDVKTERQRVSQEQRIIHLNDINKILANFIVGGQK